VSSILKALRKLEEEKSRSREGTPDIARDILKSGPRRKSSTWMTVASIAVLVLAFALTGYILVWKSKFPAPPESSQTIHEVPQAKVPDVEKETAAQAVARPESQLVPAKVSAEPKPLPAPAAKKSPSKTPSSPALSAPTRTATEPVKAVQSAGAVEKKEAAGRMPALKLTGIAFQEDRAARLAVINDLPVMEGTMIEGARVMEISEDRVRFNYSGRNFEVLLDGPR
jgi:general secretion pathway protein B